MGVLYMLLASGCFASMSAFVKAVGSSLPLPELVFLRCLLAIPILLVIVLARGRPLLVRAKKTLLLRTLFGMTAMFGFFYGLTHLPLAEAIFIGRSQPLILSLLSPLVLGEKAPLSAWIAIGTGLIGVSLIMQPATATLSLGAWAALGAAVASALAHMMVRRLNATDFPLVIVFNFTVLTCLCTAFWVVPRFVAPSGAQWGIILCIALFASCGQLFMTLAYQRDTAPVVASASYTSVVLALVYGYLFWGELPGPLTWGGGFLIIAGGLMLLRSRLHIGNPASTASA